MADPGTTLNGRFRLDRLIGQGGFAQVFLSTDLLLDRQVAVKVLRPEQLAAADAGAFLERFAAEARLIARLEHPNILGLYDFGQSNGLAYLVMPYVAGGSLHDARRRAGRFDPAQTANYLRQMAAALDYAHRNNVVHRDIKPQNMLLREEGAQLLVADFGIAKVLREESGQSSTAVIGSAAYMAPEQFQGRVGRATDIYALGCVAYELLTGAPPYPGPAERSMFGHVYGELPRLATALADAPPALQAVIDRALAKQPDDRYPTAGALAAAFATALAPPDAPTQRLAAPPPGEPPTRKIAPLPAPQPLPAPLPASPTTPLAPGEEAPTSALPATPPPRRHARLWWAAGLVILLAIAAIVYFRDPDGITGATTRPTATIGVRAFTPPQPITLSGHTKLAERTAWSPDGEFLATAGFDTTVRWWRKDGQLVRVITAHTDEMRALGWSPDSKLLATGGKDGKVLIWAREKQEPVARIEGNGDTVSALSWSPDGNVLVVASSRLRFYSTATWAEIVPAYPNDNGIHVLAWSPDGKLLAVGAVSGSLRLFLGDATLAASLPGHTGAVTGVAWSPDSTRLASAGGNLLLWNATLRQLITAPAGHSGMVRGVAWSPDGRTIASGADDQTVRLWNPAGGALATLTGHTREVNRVAWLAEGTLVSGDNDSNLRWWSASGALLGQAKADGCGVIALAPAPAESAVAVVQTCGTPQIWR